MDALDPNENPEGYILHLEDLLRDRQRIIKDLEWKLKEVHRCTLIQEECATTAVAHAERMEGHVNRFRDSLKQIDDVCEGQCLGDDVTAKVQDIARSALSETP